MFAMGHMFSRRAAQTTKAVSSDNWDQMGAPRPQLHDADFMGREAVAKSLPKPAKKKITNLGEESHLFP